MTREQAEKEIRDTFTEVWADGIIKALEQEPCEDCINRESALMCLTGSNLPNDTNKLIALFNKRLQELPSVQPTRIKAKWLKHERLEYDGYIDTMWECSICGQQEYTTEYKYCPNCGAKMESEG